MKKGQRMDIETLAYKMRERAIDVERAESQQEKEIRKQRIQQLENLKSLYYNAGRWAGGARDKKAREAFERVRLHG
jgi:hypothetical protein